MTETIEGTITLDGVEVGSVQVLLVHHWRNEIIDITETDSNGQYQFDNVDEVKNLMVVPWHYDSDGWENGDYTNLQDAFFAADPVANVTGSLLFQETNAPPLPDGTTHYYPMSRGSSDTARDLVGGVDGTMESVSWTSGSDWIGENAAGFDGSTSGIELDDPVISSGDFTILLTAYIQGDVDVRQVLFDHAPEALIAVRDRIEAYTEDTFTRNVDTTPDASENTFYRIAVIRDGNSLSLWINGTEYTSDSGSTHGTEAGYWIGNSGGVDWYFDGIIDNLLVVDRALSSAEVQDDYEAQPWV